MRSKILGTAQRPRLSVYRSLQHIYGQLIDDQAGRTMAAASDLDLKKKKTVSKSDLALQVGGLLGEKALKKGIKEVVFDRGSYKYHGRVKALAEGARQAGLKI